ncbi:hypothetical protein [Bradyrhizobium iriomotense]|uniref:Uncharacterized protein n=1 Tax=Bradyrhizobium iriomotense TaxID=441950 RepID=A0ABQ6B4Y3_9BRAD|nr:hypothetical protein [Bradyrhizobium iriomotense]GLR89143.1 hypothetical protein GCM10007857_58560 [Bradyrhizobium iriomotense]
MVMVRFLFAFIVWGAVALTPVLAAPLCKEQELGGKDAPMLSPPMANVVTGAGRLQFYSAPNPACAMNGIFVIRRDELIAYAQTDDGWA